MPGSSRSTEVGGLPVVLMDSVAGLEREHERQVVVTGSAGTLAAAQRALAHPPRLIAFHDAGVGKDRAGVRALERLEPLGLAAVAVAHDTARIGDADDVLEHGVIAHANAAARALGLRTGEPLKAALARLGR